MRGEALPVFRPMMFRIQARWEDLGSSCGTIRVSVGFCSLACACFCRREKHQPAAPRPAITEIANNMKTLPSRGRLERPNIRSDRNATPGQVQFMCHDHAGIWKLKQRCCEH
jgi:hypothetical protein